MGTRENTAAIEYVSLFVLHLEANFSCLCLMSEYRELAKFNLPEQRVFCAYIRRIEESLDS